MKDPRKGGRASAGDRPAPKAKEVRAAAADRGTADRVSPASSRHIAAHAQALGASHPTVSPAKARAGGRKLGEPGSFGLPD
jgi:hypothetical protein